MGAGGRQRLRGEAGGEEAAARRVTDPTAPGPVEGRPSAGLVEGSGHGQRHSWPLWEVFVRPRRGLSHTHVGSVHAPDGELALQNARDVFTRRGEGVSIWVVPSAHITATSPQEKDRYFDPAADKVYRHPTFYELPEEVRQL